LFNTREAETDAANLRDFRRAEKIVLDFQARNGRLPKDDELQAAAGQIRFEMFWNKLLRIKPTPLRGCDENDDLFGPERNDHFVLLIWRGEHDDCYASPSGKTTLQLSRWEWMKFNLRIGGPLSLGSLLLGLLIGFAAFQLFPRGLKSGTDQATSSS